MKLNKIKDFTETKDAAAFTRAVENRFEGAKTFEISAPVMSAPAYQANAAAA